MRVKKIRKTVIAAAALTLAFMGAPCVVYAAGSTLKVGVRDDIMHMGYLNPDTGKYYGLEIDLAAELADSLGYKSVEYITVEPDDRKEVLLSGEVDCLIAAYSVEASRLENFDFSPAYYVDHSVIMVEKSSLITEISQLVGKKTGVLNGANTGAKLSEKMIELGLITEEDTKGSSLEKMESYEALSTALEEGDVDAVCMDGCIARAYMEDDREILDEQIGEEQYAVATQKDSALSEKVSAAIQKMLDDGTIDRLIEKWN